MFGSRHGPRPPRCLSLIIGGSFSSTRHSRYFSKTSIAATLPFLERMQQASRHTDTGSRKAAKRDRAAQAREEKSLGHLNLHADVPFILNAYCSSQEKLLAEEAIKDKIQHAFDSSFLQDQLTLVDVNTKYARDLEFIEPEFLIQSLQRPIGPEPKTEEDPRSSLYHYTARLENLIPSTSTVVPGTYFPAIRLTPDARMPSFVLHRPNPIHSRLIDIIQTYRASLPELADLVSLTILWARSHGMAEFSPVSLSLMTIAFLQIEGALLNLQSPSRLEHVASSEVWAPNFDSSGVAIEEYSPSGSLHDTRFFTPTRRSPQVRVGTLFIDWLQYFSEFSAKNRFISIRNGGQRLRIEPLKEDVSSGTHVKLVGETIDGKDWVQPKAWESQPLVLQDPFIPTFNHLAHITLPQWNHFRNKAMEAHRNLTDALPLLSAFGPFLPRPTPQSGHLHGRLTSDLEVFAESCQAPTSVLRSRKATISRIQRVITKKFGPQYTVEVFGSTRYGVDSSSSDLDLVIVDGERPNGVPQRGNKLPDVYNMARVAGALRYIKFGPVQAIAHATVPIVKARDPETGIDVDINTNSQLGLRNTLMIEHYCTLSPILRPLLLFIKAWARSHGLNSPSGAVTERSMSSYCYTLMTIGFLQMRGVLPNLQAKITDLQDPSGLFWAHQKTGPELCDSRFRKYDANAWSGSSMSLGAAVHGWFSYWAEEHDYLQNAMDVKEGGLTRRAYPFFLEELPNTFVTKGIAKRLVKAQKEKPGNDDGLVEVVSQTEAVAPEVVKDAALDEEAVLDAFLSMSVDERNPDSNDIQEELDQVDEITEGPAEVLLVNSTKSRTRRQVQQWEEALLVVPDPFILSKNVGGNYSIQVVQRFRLECKRAMWLLQSGQPVIETFGLTKSREEFARLSRGKSPSPKTHSRGSSPHPGRKSPNQKAIA